jgi:osmotically-inducible protein OsmY
MKNVARVLNLVLCLTLVVALASCASSEKSRSTGQVVDDSAITAKVKADLAGDPATKARNIKVDTYMGEVILSGFVDSAAEKNRAGEIARNVKGVMKVKNDLTVK